MTVDHAARRGRVRAALAPYGVDRMLVTDRSNVRWLTGFSGSNATLLLRAAGATLVTDGRYVTQAHREVPGLGEAVQLVTERLEDWLDGLADGRPLGVEAEHLTWARARTLTAGDADGAAERLIAVDDVVPGERQVKDDAELAVLAAACRVTAEAFTAMWTWLAPGMSERQVAHRLLGEMIERGADAAAFDFIVASGPGGAEPHHRPTDTALRAGDLVTVDAGALVGGYHADMTRTVALGRPSTDLAAVYDVVAAAQRRGVAACRPDTPARAVDEACREVIAEAGHGLHFVHPTGHGVGLDIHEQPILHGRQEARLRAGMAVTVEPGIYIPGVGGVRIEDVVGVGDGSPRVLTTTHHDAAPGTPGSRGHRDPVADPQAAPAAALSFHPLIEL